MSEEALKALSDLASEAHTRIQAAHDDINPVIGVRRGMRDIGIPADAMTIECLRTRRRITLVLHDEKPGLLLYQFSTIDEEAGVDFRQMALSEVGVGTLYDWMQDYFSPEVPDSPVH